MATLTDDVVLGSLLGTAVGDALGMPIEGLSHANVRTYYKGIKEYRDDDQRKDLGAGQWTDDTQMTFAVAQAVAASPGEPGAWPGDVAAAYVDLRDRARRWGPTTTAAVDRLAEGAAPEEAGSSERATNGAAMRAAPLGLWAAVSERERDEVFTAVRAILAVTHRHPAALAAGWGQAAAVRYAAESEPDAFDRDAFWQAVVEATEWAEARLAQASNANGNANATPNGEADRRVSRRLHRLAGQLDSFPLDLRDECDGITARADEAWPFACAMFARRPQLLENSILSGVNVGGDADTTGAMMGALFGALHGWDAFPDDWKEGLEDRERLAEEAQAFGRSVRSS